MTPIAPISSAPLRERQHPRLPCARGNRRRRPPEEYFEALRHSGRPRRPEEYFLGVEDQSIRDHLGERSVGSDPQPRSPLWSRAAYDRYLEWAFETGTTDNGVFGAKLMWGYFGDFVSLLRNIPAYRDVPLAELLPTRLPRPHLRPRRAREQDAAGGLALEGGADGDLARGPGDAPRPPRSRRTARPLPQLPRGAPAAASLPLPGDRPPARPAPGRGGLLGRLLRALRDQADPRPLRELRRRLRDQHPQPARATRPLDARDFESSRG